MVTTAYVTAACTPPNYVLKLRLNINHIILKFEEGRMSRALFCVA